jgi:uncharacterized protein (TIGR01244 family)
MILGKRVPGLACAVAACVWFAAGASAHAQQAAAKMLAPGVFVAGAIAPADIAAFRQGGGAFVVDLLPDDEAAPQARSPQMDAAARDAGLGFVYAPTKSSPLSAQAVAEAGKALASGKRPILIYCRSGSRASRVWALVEASRVDGMDIAGILRSTAAAGYSVDDMRGELERRIGARGAK